VQPRPRGLLGGSLGNPPLTALALAALLSSKIVKGSTLKAFPGLPQGMCTTLKHWINSDLLAFFGT